MDAKSTRAWLEKICGAQAIDVAGLAADQARREELIAAHISGPEFETLKAETRDFLLSIAFSGKEIKRPKLMRGIDEKIVFGEMDLEFDTGADGLAGASILRDGTALDPDSEDGKQFLLDLRKTMQPLMDKSQAMADSGLFDNRAIEAQLWTPLVRQGIIPSNLVPDAFSETARVFREGSEVYTELMEEEDGSSMAPDKAGMAIRGLKHLVNLGKVAGGEVLRYVDFDIVEASRQDLAEFIAGRNKLDISKPNLEKLNGLRDLSKLSGAPLPSPEGKSEEEYDQAMKAYFEENQEDLEGLGIEEPEQLETALAEERDLIKLENMSDALGQDGLSDAVSADGEASTTEMLQEAFEAREDKSLSIDDWIAEQTQGETDQATLDAYEGFGLQHDFGEHLKHKAMLKVAGSAASMVVDCAEKRHQKAAKRDMLESILTNSASIVGGLTFFDEDSKSLTMDPASLNEQHKAKYGELAAQALTRGMTKLSRLVKPPKGETIDKRDLLTDYVVDICAFGGETIAAGGTKTAETDTRVDLTRIGDYVRGSGVIAKFIDRAVLAAETGDYKTALMELGTLAGAMPMHQFVGQVGDLTRIDRELSEIPEGTDNPFDPDGSGGLQAWAANPLIEVRGAGGQTEFGMNGDLATVNDERAVISDSLDLLREMEAGRTDAQIKDRRADWQKRLDKARRALETTAAEPSIATWLANVDLATVDPGELADKLTAAMAAVDDVVAQARDASKQADAAIVDTLSDAVDKKKLTADLAALRQLTDTASAQNPPDQKQVEKLYASIQKEMLKDARVLADLQADLEEDNKRIERLKDEADMTQLAEIADATRREQQRTRALEAITQLTQELKWAEQKVKMGDQISKGVLGIAAAAAPGAALAMKVRDMVFDVMSARKRLSELKLWKKQMEAMAGNYSVYEYVAKGEKDQLKVLAVEDHVNIAADVAGVTAETLRLVDQTHITAAVATTVEKGTKAIKTILATEYKNYKIKEGWEAYKKALDNPADRIAARKAIRLNTTMSKCVLAYGACVAGDAEAQKAMVACGLTPAVMEDTNEICHAAVDYLRARISDSDFETIADHEAVAWMTVSPAPEVHVWLTLKSDALRLRPALAKASFPTPGIDRSLSGLKAARAALRDLRDQLEAEDDAQARAPIQAQIKAAEERFATEREGLISGFGAYVPLDDTGKRHARMTAARDAMIAEIPDL